MEEFKTLFTSLISPLIASLLTYIILIKGKIKDVGIEKTKKLNIVISNLLDVWDYLNKLDNLSKLKKTDLPVPFKIIPHILLNSKTLNDKSFMELENSIDLLKEYDPVTYYELSGIGNKFEEIKTNYILPFLNAKNQNVFNTKVSNSYIQQIKTDIEEYLISISKLLDYKIKRRIKEKIKKQKETNYEEIKNELLENYYEFMIALIPKNQEKPTFKEFIEEITDPKIKELLDEQMQIFIDADFGEIMKNVAEDPYISIDVLKNKLDF